MDPEDTGIDTSADVDNTDASQGNPAWQELYGVLPDSLQTVVAPVLDKWERRNQAQIQQYAEQVQAYEPYKEFVDNGVPVEQMEAALQVMALIDSNPQEFMQQMQAFYGGDNAQQQDTGGQQQKTNPNSNDDYSGMFDEAPFDISSDPTIQQLKNQQDIIAGFLASQVEAEQQQVEDAQLDADLAALKEKFGDYDEQYVVGLAVNGIPLEEGVQRYQQMVNNIRTTPTAQDGLPNIMAPGGGTPSEAVNPADMTTEQRKAFVMRALAQANSEG